MSKNLSARRAMFDKMIFNVCLSVENAQLVIGNAGLQKCTKGNQTFYQSKDDYKFSGVFIKLDGNKLQLKCSLHKYYYKMTRGILENCGEFSMSAAHFTFFALLEKIGINPENVYINSYEIGFNINTDHEPLKYIDLIRAVGVGNNRREMFVDANFDKNRQKTSKKSKTVKKYYKIYDKGFEMADRRREDKTNTAKILRLETVYKRVKEPAYQFFNMLNLNNIAKQFFIDWLASDFERIITATKGVKASQKNKAERLVTLGRLEYLKEAQTLFNDLKISEKEYRNIKEFVRDWGKNKSKFKFLPSLYEYELKCKIQKALNC